MLLKSFTTRVVTPDESRPLLRQTNKFLHIIERGCSECDFFFMYGMENGKGFCMEHGSRKILSVPVSIKAVPENRQSEKCKLEAYLVGPAGFGLCANERKSGKVSGSGKYRCGYFPGSFI
jgi:hypothetical protein